jgi:hypothetical protein
VWLSHDKFISSIPIVGNDMLGWQRKLVDGFLLFGGGFFFSLFGLWLDVEMDLRGNEQVEGLVSVEGVEGGGTTMEPNSSGCPTSKKQSPLGSVVERVTRRLEALTAPA